MTIGRILTGKRQDIIDRGWYIIHCHHDKQKKDFFFVFASMK